MEKNYPRARRRAAATALTAVVTAAGLLLGTAGAGATPLDPTEGTPITVVEPSVPVDVEQTAPETETPTTEPAPVAPVTPDSPAPAVADLHAASDSAPALAAAVQGPFKDVTATHKFAREINWMFATGLSTGTQGPTGREFRPSDRLTREAMAAFMFRKYASPSYQAPARSWFNDVKPGAKFYREISWMYEYGLSTGVTNQYDGRIYQPKQQLSREAMAAFMYRALYLGDYFEHASYLVDVDYGDPFSNEISWMFDVGLSTGVNTPSGTAYQPKGKLSREAMAAFMYRSKAMPADITRIANPTPPPPAKPRPKPPVVKPPTTKPPTSTYFENCTEAWNAGAAPVRRGDPGYGPHLDRDGDGIGCEKRPR